MIPARTFIEIKQKKIKIKNTIVSEYMNQSLEVKKTTFILCL